MVHVNRCQRAMQPPKRVQQNDRINAARKPYRNALIGADVTPEAGCNRRLEVLIEPGFP